MLKQQLVETWTFVRTEARQPDKPMILPFGENPIDGFPRITERGATGQSHYAGLPLTIVAYNIGCAFAETDVGEGDEQGA
jgi:hypothetical protein